MNIPISASVSQSASISTPLSTQAGTVFNFSSPGSSGDWYSMDVKSDPSASATSLAAQGDASLVTPLTSKVGGVPVWAWLVGGLVLVGGGIYLYMRK